MTPPRYDLKQWWSKVTKSPYEKFIPWSRITTWRNGLDPELNDQVIFQMLNVNEIYERNMEIFGQNMENLSTTDGSYPYDFMRPNVDNEFRLSLKFMNSNGCERLAIIEDKYEKYHNDLNIALYGNEEQFNVENAEILGLKGYSGRFYYEKQTCERMHEWSDILILILPRSGGPDLRSSLFKSITLNIHVQKL